MRLRFSLAVLSVLLAALLVLPSTLAAGVEGKGGFFDASLDRDGRIGTRFVQWLWWPYQEIGSAPYVVYAFCERYDVDGQPVGKNKVAFNNVVLRGVDTDTEVTLRRRSVRLRDGLQPSIVTWDVSELATIAHETVVIGRAEIKIKGAVAAGDLVHCEIGTAELSGGDG